jgi:endothelin-converting enzyme
MYNQKGKLEEWWTNETSTKFDVIQKCISKQYSCWPTRFKWDTVVVLILLSAYTIDDGKGNQIPVNVGRLSH